jgi:hypothetical protein
LSKQWNDKDMLEFARIASEGSYGDYKGCKSLQSKLKKYKLMSKETVKKYSVELHFVEMEVDKDSIEKGCIEVTEVGSNWETLKIFDDYDEAQESFKDYVKQLT